MKIRDPFIDQKDLFRKGFLMKKSSLLAKKLNQKFEQSEISFSTTVLKPSEPYVLLIEDHARRNCKSSPTKYKELHDEVATSIRHFYRELEGAENTILFEEIFISPALLYSSYHYIVTFI